MAVGLGDYVRVVDRQMTPADVKSGLYYHHFRGLEGTVERLYADGAACVVVSHATLRPDMVARLKRAERVIKPRWKTLAPAMGTASSADTSTVSDAPQDGEELVAVADEAPEPPIEEVSDGRPSPGLKYAIVLKTEDLLTLRGGSQPVARETIPQALPTGVRVSEEQLKLAEARHMQELIARAEGRK